MILEPKKAVVAYRCIECGEGVMGFVGTFSLAGSMLRLKCRCGKSEMTVARASDGKVNITAPCLFCPHPHKYTLSSPSFFDREIFTLDCTYTGFPTVIIGKQDKVEAELDRSYSELVKENPEAEKLFELGAQIRGGDISEDELGDEVMNSVLAAVLEHCDVSCNCENASMQSIGGEINGGEFKIYCRTCGAQKVGTPQTDDEIREFFSVDDGVIELR